jgi:prepilin-type N-terminal cleavage/methylation domain-containing protein
MVGTEVSIINLGKGSQLIRKQEEMTDKQLNMTNKGFTLVELLVAMAIFSILSIAIVQQLTEGSRITTEQSAATRAQQSLRIARIMMTQDIRLAGLDPIRSFRFGFEEASSTKFRVTADINRNGDVDDVDFERVTYDIRPGTRDLIKTFYEGTGAADTGILVDRIDPAASGFAYLDEAGNNLGDPVPAANLEDIRVVVINLAVEELAGRVGTVTRNSGGRVMCRNLGI